MVGDTHVNVDCGTYWKMDTADEAEAEDVDAWVPNPFVSQRQIVSLTHDELRAAVGNALTVHPRDCRRVLVNEIMGRLTGKIPRD